jgi:transcriptional regulator with XRE-family HTH domain
MAEVSEKIGVDVRTYGRWELGTGKPRLTSLKQLCELFELSADELGFVLDRYLSSSEYE